MSKPTLQQILDALKRQILVGKSYLEIAKGLQQADPAILQTAPTFFGLTMDGGIELAQLVIARVYDRTKGTVTVMAMLFEAASRIDEFKHGGRAEVSAAILKCAHRGIALQPIVDAIRRRRNKWLAHLDPEAVRDPVALSMRAKLTIPDLDLVFAETEKSILEMSSLYEGTIGELRFLGGDDFEMALDWLRKAKCEFIANYEKEFKLPWTGPKPRNFTTGNFAMW